MKQRMCLLALMVWGISGYSAQAQQPEQAPGITVMTTDEACSEPPAERLSQLWEFAKGAPPDNSIVLGMRSHHTNDEQYNDNNHMVAIDYNGYTAGTFNNSFRQQVFFAGVCREIYRHRISRHMTIDIRYRAGLMHGYRSHYPNIQGFSAVALPFTSFCYKRVGIDLLVTPSSRPVFAFSLRLKML
jgi:hypothetical protein